MPSSAPVLATPLTRLFKINHPVMLCRVSHLAHQPSPETSDACSMNVAAGPKLAAAVTNAGTAHSSNVFFACSNNYPGGIGVIGGLRQSPMFLQGSIDELKSCLEDKNAPFGVDLLLPQIGGNARKTKETRWVLAFNFTHASSRKTTLRVNCQSSLTSSSKEGHPCSFVPSVSHPSGPSTSSMLLAFPS